MPVNVAMPKLGMTMTEGTLKRWLKGEGQEVEKGTPVLEIETEKIVYEIEATASGLLHIIRHEGSAVPCGGACGVIASSQEEYRSLAGDEPVGSKDGGWRVTSSPAARRLASELNVDMSRLPGTGPGGRILEDDVRKAAAAPKAVESARVAKTIPLSGRRKIIADHMVKS
ncbi:MAG: E3 binding domain-containing protein, partial [Dehalococcoidia bacterium]|nr:E3 binding domain-containing protein [Dehalococcoidia bacterium]